VRSIIEIRLYDQSEQVISLTCSGGSRPGPGGPRPPHFLSSPPLCFSTDYLLFPPARTRRLGARTPEYFG